MSQSEYIGWDIGGAHLKMAHIGDDGSVLSAVQIPTPLWEGKHVFTDALSDARRSLPQKNLQHAFTTTAELADIFSDRKSGISEIAIQLNSLLNKQNSRFYAGEKGWISPLHAVEFVDEIASANWHATARYVASRLATGILVDIGSTTTDIIPFANHTLCYSAYGDYQRLQHGELVYTGIIRTPVMAITDAVTIEGEKHPLVAEHFATMADVYRISGELQEEDDMMDTADGAGKSVRDSARRLVRMVGADLSEDDKPELWRVLAETLATEQLQRINRSLNKVIAQCKIVSLDTLVGAGAGRFLVRKLADHLGLHYVDFADIINAPETLRSGAARSAAAIAVAQLSRMDAGEG